MPGIAENLKKIEDRIHHACSLAGRSRDSVKLMAVSKLQPWERIEEALDLGLRFFGESRVQETVSRADRFPDDAEVHLIGHLQRNKARDAARLYHGIQSLDAVKTVHVLERKLAETGRRMTAMVEVNTSGEESKHGVTDYNGLLEVVRALEDANHLDLTGLMTIGPFTTDESALRSAFSRLRAYQDQLQRELHRPLRELSMGMSNDLETAILEGSTLVRIGGALFGPREYGR